MAIPAAPVLDAPSADERDRRWSAVRELMEDRGLDCLIVFGSDSVYRDCCQNLRYLTNVPREGYLVFPRAGEPTLITFENGLDPVWVEDWRGGVPAFSSAIADRLEQLGLGGGRIGTVGTGGFYGETAGFPQRCHRSLTAALPGAELVEATDLVEGLRAIKSGEEIECLEAGCRIMEQVFEAVVATAGIGVRDIDVRAAILDTLFRSGCDQGAMLLYCQGDAVMHAGQRGARLEPGRLDPLADGDVILIEVDAVWRGYKAQFNQPFVLGEAGGDWPLVFETAQRCFEAGVAALGPDASAGELEDALVAPILEADLTFGNPAFHGLGLGIEAPVGTYPRANHRLDRETVLRTGMVLELEPHPVTRDLTRGASVGCPVLVTGEGCRQIPGPWWRPAPIAIDA